MKRLFLFHTGALVVYKPHGYLWVQFFVILFYFFIFVPTWDGWGLQVRLCHMDIELCWFFFEEERQVSQEHGHDPPTGPLCVVMENWWSTTEEREGNQGWALFVECRAAKPWREEKVIRVHLVSALVSTSTLGSPHLPSPTHLCTFVHSSCEVQFWGCEHNYNRRIATTLTKSLKKIYSQTEIRDSRRTSSPTSCI